MLCSAGRVVLWRCRWMRTRVRCGARPGMYVLAVVRIAAIETFLSRRLLGNRRGRMPRPAAAEYLTCSNRQLEASVLAGAKKQRSAWERRSLEYGEVLHYGDTSTYLEPDDPAQRCPCSPIPRCRSCPPRPSTIAASALRLRRGHRQLPAHPSSDSSPLHLYRDFYYYSSAAVTTRRMGFLLGMDLRCCSSVYFSACCCRQPWRSSRPRCSRLLLHCRLLLPRSIPVPLV